MQPYTESIPQHPDKSRMKYQNKTKRKYTKIDFEIFQNYNQGMKEEIWFRLEGK